MANDAGERSSLPPDDAFSVLGNETRMEILRALGDVAGPEPFSKLYDRVDVDDSGQFSYHLEKLLGHFVRKTDDGYVLREAGTRVIEAVLSGAITETPEMAPTAIDAPCPYCGGTIEVSYREDRLLQRCTDCAGQSTESGRLPRGTLAMSYLPPAGLEDRTPEELVTGANTWAVIEQVAMANGVCPRCSGNVDHEIRACPDHSGVGVCDRCGRRHVIRVDSRCLNCPHSRGGLILRLLMGEPAFRSFYERHDVDVFSLDAEEGQLFVDFEEEVLATDPLEARVTIALDGDAITFAVNDDASIEVVSTGSGDPRGVP